MGNTDLARIGKGILGGIVIGFAGLCAGLIMPFLIGLLIDVIRDPPSTGTRVTEPFARSAIVFAPLGWFVGAWFGWKLPAASPSTNVADRGPASKAARRTAFAFGGAVLAACGTFFAVVAVVFAITWIMGGSLQATSRDNGGAAMGAAMLATYAAFGAAIAGSIYAARYAAKTEAK